MRICVAGAGATGGHFAVRLALGGHDVSVLARGSHLAAIRQDGLTLLQGDRRFNARLRASDRGEDLGSQDFVIVGVKATGLAAIAPELAPLIDPRTLVAFPQNGVGWWYPIGLPPDRPPPPDLPSFALARTFLRMMDEDQIVAGSIYSANDVAEPGVIRNNSLARNLLILGLLRPERSAALAAVCKALIAVGIGQPPTQDHRETMWAKLIANMSGSTIVTLAGSRSSICRTDPDMGRLLTAQMHEGMAIARAHGYPVDHLIDIEKLRAAMQDHKPSLLQDFELRRPMEVAEIVQAPLAFARAAGVATPVFEVVATLITRKAKDAGLL